MISESYLYKNRNDSGTRDLVNGSGLELDKDPGYSTPTANSIKKGIIEFGLSYKTNQLGEARFELEASGTSGRKLVIEFNENHDLTLIEIFGGSDQDLVIDFFRSIKRYHGKFIYYGTSGAMSLITREKSNDQICKDMGMWRIEKDEE